MLLPRRCEYPWA